MSSLDRRSFVQTAAFAAAFGGLHIAVNNAGVNKNSAAEDTPAEEWDMTFDVNTRGTFLCCQQEARHMLANGGGKLLRLRQLLRQRRCRSLGSMDRRRRQTPRS